jgi:hypothetical protein
MRWGQILPNVPAAGELDFGAALGALVAVDVCAGPPGDATPDLGGPPGGLWA